MVWDIATFEKETKLSAHKFEHMRLFDKKINDEIILSTEEKNSLQKLLVDAIGNMDFNKKIGALSSYSKYETGIGSLAIALLKSISYRTRSLNNIIKDADEIWLNYRRGVKGDAPLNDKEKISLKQYGILHDLSYLYKQLKVLDDKGLIAGNASLETLYKHCQHAEEIINHFDNTFDSHYKMPTGSIVFDVTKNKASIHNKSMGFFERLLAFFVTKFGHSSKGLSASTSSGKENKVSHINPTYAEEKFSLRSFLYSDVYQIKLDKLIDNSTKDFLRKNLGANWLETIEKKYSKIERELHDKSLNMHQHIVAESSFKRGSKMAVDLLLGGHKNFFKKDHRNVDIRDNIFGRGKWEAERRESCKMLCSEFIGMTVIASIQELNDRIRKDLLDKGVTDIPTTLIKSPISEKEKLFLLTPERLLTAMQARGAVEKVSAPNEIRNFIKIK